MFSRFLARLEGRKAAHHGTASFVSWHGPGRPMWSNRDYAALAREGYARNAIAYRCVRLIAEAAAAVPWRVHPVEHPLAQLLARPNPEQIHVELMEMFYGHLQVSGNGYLQAVSLDEAPPSELYALRPDRMAVLPGLQGWPLGWEYRGPEGPVRFERCILTERSPILHVKLFNPTDDWYGLSPMEAAACAIDIHNAGGAWNKALIDNAARPSGALVVNGGPGADRLTTEQYDRLRRQLEDAHVGAGNAGRPLLLEGGLDWKPMSLSPSDMDFIEARFAASREIALAFGVPPMLLGIPGDNTYANYREANLALLRQTVLPLVQKAARAVQQWLGARWEMAEKATIDLDLDAVAGLATERESAWMRVSQATFLTDQEKRAMVGVAPSKADPR